jgi:hypothetical protein
MEMKGYMLKLIYFIETLDFTLDILVPQIFLAQH